MSEFLLLRLGRDPDVPIEWLIWDRQASRMSDSGQLAHAGELPALATASNARRCYVLLPQEQVLLTEARLPNTRRGSLAAIPYQLEDQLCDDPAELHFAVGQPGPERRFAVVVVARTLVGQWRDRLVDAGLAVDGLFAEAQCLQSEQPEAIVQGERLLVSIPGERSLALRRDEREHWLPLLARYGTLEDVVPPPDAPPLATLAPRIAPQQGIDLLQGDFRLQRDASRLRRWRLPALLTLLLAVLHFAGLGLEHYRLSQQKSALDDEIAALFQSALPDTRRMVNPKAQLARQLDELRQRHQGPPFLRLVQETLPAFARHDGVQLQALAYDQAQAALRLRLRADDSGTLERFAATLAASGQRVQTGASRRQDNASEVEITLEETP
ncbi:MAG: type II secretion system protein GspL [Oceanospirillaceae bacterium]|nr:type II secretion system protein GspL [Oceanospirillaceae bacterium]